LSEFQNKTVPLTGQRGVLLWAILLLSLLAIGISSYLTWTSWQQADVAGCTGGEGFGCDEVLGTSWSKWLGLPVSMLGGLTYVGILVFAWPAAKRPSGWSGTMLLSLALIAAGAAVWFIGLQAFVLRYFCPYCMVVHSCGLLMPAAAWWLLKQPAQTSNIDQMRSLLGVETGDAEEVPSASLSPFQPLIAAGVASVGLAVLIGGQTLFAPSNLELVTEAPPLEIVDEQGVEVQETPSPDVSTEQLDDNAAVESKTEPEVGVEEEVVPEVATEAEPEPDTSVAPVEASESTEVPAEYPAPQPAESEEKSRQPEVAFMEEKPTQTFEDIFGEDPNSAELFSDSEESSPEVDSLFDEPALQNEPLTSSSEEQEAEVEQTEHTEQTQQVNQTEEPGSTSSPRVVRFTRLKEPVDLTEVPLLGNPDAEFVLVEMLDYTCTHCRQLHPFIEETLGRYGDQFAFVIFHVPLSKHCNPAVKYDQSVHRDACDYATLACSVWHLAPEKFAEFHHYLMDGRKPPSVYEARKRADHSG